MQPNQRNDAIRAIAYLTALVRPDWDRAGVETVLQRINSTVSIAAMTHAAITCAELRHDQRTPAIIATAGAHWHHTDATTPPKLPRDAGAVRQAMQEHATIRKPSPQRMAELRALMRAGIAPSSPEANAWLANNPVTLEQQASYDTAAAQPRT